MEKAGIPRWFLSGFAIAALCLLAMNLTACGIIKDKNGFGSKPPQPAVAVKELDNKKVSVHQSSYCWVNQCADYPRPDMLLKDNKKLAVPSKATLSYQFPDPAPDEVSLSLFTENGDSQKVELTNGSFQAPEKPGVYYYGLVARWPVPSKIPNSGYNSAFAFAVEVASGNN